MRTGVKTTCLFLGLVAAGAGCQTVGSTAPVAPPGADEPVFDSTKNASLYYDNWDSYTSVTQLWSGGGLYSYIVSSETQSSTTLVTGGADGDKAVDFYYDPSAYPILENWQVGTVAPNNTAVGPDVIVITWYYRQTGTQLYMGKLWATYSTGPGNQNRYMLEHTNLSGQYEDEASIGYSCFWAANGNPKTGGAPVGTDGPGWYHDDLTAPNGIGALFTQNMNYGTGTGQWSAAKLLDGQWHRYTTRFSKGANWQALGVGYQRVEMWADGVKIMEYVGDDRSRCEYGHIWGMQPDTKMVNGYKIGGPESIPAAPRVNHVMHDGMRIWTP